MRPVYVLQFLTILAISLLTIALLINYKRPIVIDVESQGHICQKVLYEDDERVACRIIIEVGMQ